MVYCPIMNRPNILLISRNFPPLLGGMERLNQHLLLELHRTYDVHLVGPEGAADYVPHPEWVSACPAAPIHRFLTTAMLSAAKVARRIQPHLIIAGSGVNAVPAWVAARASGAPWMVYLHGLDISFDHWAYRRVFLPIIRRANGWIVNSHATATLAYQAGLAEERVHILHPGVAVPSQLPSAEEIATWCQKFGLGNRPIMLSVGRLTKRKGLREFVLKAMPAILQAVPETLLVVIGEEPKSALAALGGLRELHEAIDQTHCGEHVKFLGEFPLRPDGMVDRNLSLAYSAASVLVFPVLDIPSDVEGFGMVAIEAAAHGLPTVAFAVGGVPDAVSSEHSGELRSPGDYLGLANAIVGYLQSGRNPRQSESCQNFAKQFSWDQFGIKLRQICANPYPGTYVS